MVVDIYCISTVNMRTRDFASGGRVAAAQMLFGELSNSRRPIVSGRFIVRYGVMTLEHRTAVHPGHFRIAYKA